VANLSLLTSMASAHIPRGVLGYQRPPEAKSKIKVCGDESFVSDQIVGLGEDRWPSFGWNYQSWTISSLAKQGIGPAKGEFESEAG
jgi:hypothetical protein